MSAAQKMAVDAIIEAMRERPRTLSCDEYTLADQQTGYEYWAASGLPFYGVHAPYTLNFGWWHGFRFIRALNVWKGATAAASTIVVTLNHQQQRAQDTSQ